MTNAVFDEKNCLRPKPRDHVRSHRSKGGLATEVVSDKVSITRAHARRTLIECRPAQFAVI